MDELSTSAGTDESILRDLLDILGPEQAATDGSTSNDTNSPPTSAPRKPQKREQNQWRKRMQSELKSLRLESAELESTLQQLKERSNDLRAHHNTNQYQGPWQRYAVLQCDLRNQSEATRKQLKAIQASQQQLINAMKPVISPNVFAQLANCSYYQISIHDLDAYGQGMVNRAIHRIVSKHESIDKLLEANHIACDSNNNYKVRLADNKEGKLCLKAVDCYELPYDLQTCFVATKDSFYNDLGAPAMDIWNHGENEVVGLRFLCRYRSIAQDEMCLVKWFEDVSPTGRHRYLLTWEAEAAGDSVVAQTRAAESGFCLLEPVAHGKTIFKSIVEVDVKDELGAGRLTIGADGANAFQTSYAAYMDDIVEQVNARMFHDSLAGERPDHGVPRCWQFFRYGDGTHAIQRT